MVVRLDTKTSWSEFDGTHSERVAQQNERALQEGRKVDAATFMSTNPVENGKRGEYLDTGYYVHKGTPEKTTESITDEETSIQTEKDYLNLPGIQNAEIQEVQANRKTKFTDVRESRKSIEEMTCTINPKKKIASIAIKDSFGKVEFKQMNIAALGHWLLSENI